ncbi:MAG: SH3 domain-containing protein [Blastocatellia bacterium]|nr:SH3 domain-containing protein [Blastocatellia bacterium]MCS7158226.1 SH3 domain-containing protein [Blastocatellia bacterium]MCX7753064.1 SH3 domain-containing protein [Blastocatellia bacterium]MDW8169380.1 SH3 domain-containing protein [Acidobacteriota bacterium]MDW8256447.1 SH3 domain-containing protein [Acidobacteriota bacterium]
MRAVAGVIGVLLLAFTGGCEERVRQPKVDDGVVLSSDGSVRSSTAVLAIELAKLRQGEEVEILERKEEWVRVRTRGGIEGWVEARHVLSKRIFEDARALERAMASIPRQALGQLVGSAAIRLTPGRASEENVLFYAPAGTVVDILRRERTRRFSSDVWPRRYQPRARRVRSSEPTPPLDLWYCVRLPESFLIRVGWVYAPLVELKIPDRLRHLQGEYAFVAWYELASIEDPEIGTSAHYLTFDTHRTAPVEGTDFERLRLWIWDVEQHRYKIGRWEIAHGVLPIEHRREATRHRFRMRLYDPKTGELTDAEYLVDVSDSFAPRLLRSRP